MSIRPCLAALASVGLVACTSLTVAGAPAPTPSGASPSPTPSPAPSTSITADNLTGAWVFGSDNEPPAGPVVACYPFKIWNLAQTGEQLKGSVLACVGPCMAFTEEVQGTNHSGQVQLTGEAAESPSAAHTPVTYDLHFDATSRHLVGTRNGQPFWAAPFTKQASGCGPAPL